MTRKITVRGDSVTDTAGILGERPEMTPAELEREQRNAEFEAARQRHRQEQQARLASRAEPKPEYPSLLQQGMNFGSAMVKWAGTGFKTRPAEEIQRIGDICKNCPSGGFDPVQERCLICGCTVKTKRKLMNKILIASEHCPRGHW